MIYGFARVSDKSQNITSQIEELSEFGVDEIVQDIVSGISEKKDGLDSLVERLESADTLIVARHDRLGRSTLQLLTLIDELEKRDVRFKILNLPDLDTRGVFAKPILAIFSAFAEMERTQLKEKQRKGIQVARKNGVKFGRPKKLNKEKLAAAFEMYDNKTHTTKQIESITGIPKATFYRRLKDRDES